MSDPQISTQQFELVTAMRPVYPHVRGINLDGIEQFDLRRTSVQFDARRVQELARQLVGKRLESVNRAELEQSFENLTNVDTETPFSLIDFMDFSRRGKKQMECASTKMYADDMLAVLETEEVIERTRELLKTSTHKLYGKSDNPLDSIRPDAIEPGTIGDCFFLAALSSVANLAEWRPKIRNMIKSNPDGTYSVTFPGAPNEPITVPPPADTEMGVFARDRGYGQWAAVLERAYGAFASKDILRRNWLCKPLPSELDAEGLDGGSFFDHGLYMLTGKKINRSYNLIASFESLHKTLTQAMRDRLPMTATTFGNPLNDTAYQSNGMLQFHEFGVMAYDSQERTITLRNPFAALGPYGQATGEATFKMTLKEFGRAFGMLAVPDNS